MGLVPDLSFVTDAFTNGPEPGGKFYLREYAPPTTDDNGNRVRGAHTDRLITAHVFPTPGEVVRHLEGGFESGATVTIRTTEEMRVHDPNSQTQAPCIYFRGRWYELSMEGGRLAEQGVSSQGEYFAKLVRRPEGSEGVEAP